MSQNYRVYVSSLRFMPALNYTVCCLFLVVSVCCTGQRSINNKDLTVSLTGGGALYKLDLDTVPRPAKFRETPSVGFTFTYSVTNRIALGMRFDRTDAERSSFFDKGRTTSYSFLAAYRPFVNDQNYLEARAGIGTGITAFRQIGRSFYSRGTGSLLRAGISWVRFLTAGFGLKFDVSGYVHSANEIRTPDGEQEWFRGPDSSVLTSRVRMATVGFLVKY